MKNENAKHTPGPWDVAGGFVGAQDPKAPSEKRRGAICKMAHTGPINYCAAPGSLEDTANARLISAAPEMAAALERVLECHRLRISLDTNSGAVEQARAAIAKARGGK